MVVVVVAASGVIDDDDDDIRVAVAWRGTTKAWLVLKPCHTKANHKNMLSCRIFREIQTQQEEWKKKKQGGRVEADFRRIFSFRGVGAFWRFAPWRVTFLGLGRDSVLCYWCDTWNILIKTFTPMVHIHTDF